MKRTLAILLLGAAAFAAPPPAATIDQVMAELEKATGFTRKRPIPVQTITREGWRAWLEEQIRENVKPEEIRAEEVTLKKFGLLPPEYDLRKATVDLLGEQAAAVYDHRKKKMIFVEGALGVGEELVLVHELAHALVDQTFDLKRFLDKAPKSDEAQLARQAVVEGQATWLMFDSQLRKMGASLKGNRAMLEMMLPATSSLAGGMFPVFEQAPLYLKETLLFPYTSGLLFQQAAIDRLGKPAFMEVLRRPPASAREILHPEIWLSGWKPEKADPPVVESLKGYAVLNEGAVGELDFRILLEQYGTRAAAQRIAAAWRGGSYSVDENKRTRRTVLRFTAVWETEEVAREFLKAYEAVLAGKWKNHRPSSSSGTLLEGEGDDGLYRIEREGRTVRVIEGLEAAVSLKPRAIY